MVNKEELKKWMEEGESETLEFKEKFSDEVIESLVGFANLKEGRVIIGINNKKELKGITLGVESLQK